MKNSIKTTKIAQILAKKAKKCAIFVVFAGKTGIQKGKRLTPDHNNNIYYIIYYLYVY